MHRRLALLSALLAAAAALGWSIASRAVAAPDPESREVLTRGFARGTWDYRAIGPLAFSPSGVLFFADDQGGAVYGVDLAEKPSAAVPFARVPDLGAVIAARLGTTPAGIEIKDIAVSPVSRAVYLSVRKTDGGDRNPADPANYALFAVDPAGQVRVVDLASLPFGKVSVGGKPSYASRTPGVPRVISDIAYARGRLFVAALSTEGFNSNLISVPVPFRQDGVERYATSIYHVSHRRQETASPIQTLTVYRDGNREYLMAAYVCTPVVRFEIEALKPNQVVQGTTVAELGSGNRPMNMIAYGPPGEQSLLLNNSVFGILKVEARIAREAQAVNERTAANRGSGGRTPYPGIEPMEALKGAQAYAPADERTLVVVKPSADGLALEPMPAP